MLSAKSQGCPERKIDSAVAVTRSRSLGWTEFDAIGLCFNSYASGFRRAQLNYPISFSL
jgi:hypothetical protein